MPQRTRKSGLQTKALRAWRLRLRAPLSGLSLFAPAALLAMAAHDAASACSADSFQLRHLHLALRVDFGPAGCGSLRGSVRLELTCLRDRASELVLDSHPSVEVQKAGLAPPGSSSCGGDGPGSDDALRPLAFQSRPFASYGSALHITLPEPLTCGDTVVLEIAYQAGSGPGVSQRLGSSWWPLGPFEFLAYLRPRGLACALLPVAGGKRSEFKSCPLI